MQKKRNPKFIEYRNLHNKEACLICGLGPSYHDLTDDIKQQYYTIGVNDICSPNYGFTPDYLIITEDPNKRFENTDVGRALNQKHIYIEKSNPKAIFSAKPGKFYYHIPVKIDLIDLRIESDIDKIFEMGKLFAYRKITTAAISLAIYMGFNLIGVIGHDCIGSRAFHEYTESLNMKPHQIKQMDEYMRIIFVYCYRNNIKIFNLSQKTALKALPTISFSKFYKLAEKLYESQS